MRKDRRHWNANDYAAERSKRLAIAGAVILALFCLAKGVIWVFERIF